MWPASMWDYTRFAAGSASGRKEGVKSCLEVSWAVVHSIEVHQPTLAITLYLPVLVLTVNIFYPECTGD